MALIFCVMSMMERLTTMERFVTPDVAMRSIASRALSNCPSRMWATACTWRLLIQSGSVSFAAGRANPS
jgi:hypothetical protein